MKNARRLIAMLMSVFFLISLIPTIVLADVTMIGQTFGEGGNVAIRTWNGYNHITYSAESEKCLGGRLDKSSVFNIGAIPDGVNVTHTNGYKWVLDATQPYTFETSVYFDGTAFPAVNVQYEDDLAYTVLMMVGTDGYVYYSNDGTRTKTDIKPEPGKWHRLVVEFQQSRGRFAIYLDGVLITDFSKWYNATQADDLWIGVASHSANGCVAFDDFKAYYGTYTKDANDAIVTTDSDGIKFDAESKVVVYDGNAYTDTASLIQAVKTATGATYANLFTDSTYETPATDLGNASALVFTSPNGNTYSYWSVRTKNFDDLVFANSFGEGAEMEIRTWVGYNHISYVQEGSAPLGGREDKSFEFTVGQIPAGVNVTHTSGYRWNTIDSSKNYTLDMNVYFDGNAYPAINALYNDDIGASVLLKVGSDNYVYYNNMGTTTKSNIRLESGQWHHIVVEFQQSRGRYALYVNGEKVTDMTSSYNANGASKVWIGTASHSFSGKVAYDDFKAYYSAYVADPADSIKTADSDNLIFNADKTLSYNPYAYTDAAALIQAVKTVAECDYVKVFTDSTYAEEAAELSDGNVLVFTSPSGKAYGYYTIKAISEKDVMMKEVGLSSNSNLVYVLDYSVGVVSHSFDEDYYTDSTEVMAALSSSNGYTLSYVDADKNETEDVDPSVTDGFIKAVKGENVFYIPVETKGKVNTNISVSPAGVAAALDNDRTGYVTVSTTASSAIGGKNAEDIDYVITSTNVPSTAKAATVGLMYKSLPAIATTFEMSVYMDGDAEFAFNGQWEESNYEALRIEDDGTIVYDNNGSYVTAPNKVETGKWHRVAITYDASRVRCIIYVDGNLITDKTRTLLTKTVMLGAGGGTTNGTVAIADFESYYGYYNYIDVVRAENGKITASVDSDLLDGECFFALAEYAEGEMVTIAPMTVSKANNVPVTLDFNAESTYKAFLWKNDASAPIATSVIYR
ncbi:MAG: hypothetical protein E7394_04945 [Ruminococcaceae bacterium]|nr:hypothetical protein [Oscillospiraceae bacterium]